MILITGAAGLVGASLAEAFRGEDVVALRHAELDIADARAVDDTMQRLRPGLVLNCAVVSVDDCENDPALAERVNASGPALLAAAAERTGAAIVHFSTNYVFDGARTTGVPYTIDDEARPINIYGATKLRGERAVIAAATRAFIIRTSWVFGSGKASFLGTVAARLARGEHVQAITDTFASTTFVNDLVTRVIEIVRRDAPGTYHVVNDGICSYETFAREAARLVGLSAEAADEQIEVATEASLARLAPRPRWTPMRCLLSEQLGLAPLRRWEDALAEYVRSSAS